MFKRLIACLCALTMFLLASAASASPSELAAYQNDKQALIDNPALEYIPNSILVKFKVSASESGKANALASANAKAIRNINLVPGLTHARTQLPVEQALNILEHNPLVEYAEPDYVQHAVATMPNDEFFGLQWGLNNTGQVIRTSTGTSNADIDMPEAWDVTTGGNSCVVADIDSGTQWSHPDLYANIWTNPDEIPGNGIDDDKNGYVDDVRGWDFVANDSNPDDENGHGTHTAGTIAAKGDNGIGIAGVAWNCKIMPLRFLNSIGSGSTADAILALNYAVAKKVKVSNNSWGGGGYSQALYDAINNAKSIGHLFVAAAGNGDRRGNGINNDTTPAYPASYDLDNIIAVSATDNNDQLASFSNYGSTSVDLGAPGVDIASTYTGDSYVWMSGTSMATPHVSGVVALVYLMNPTFTYAQVRDRIFNTVRVIPALYQTMTGGILNAVEALGPSAPSSNTAPIVAIASPSSGLSFAFGTTVTFSGSAADNEEGTLSSQLAWNSSLNGSLGTGSSISTSTLNIGTHTITASVMDSGGLKGSASITISITGTVPAAPSNVTAANNRNNSATVSWSDNSNNETSFQIERQKNNKNGSWGASSFFTVGENVTSYIDKSGSGTFRYQVRASNAAGDSAPTGWVSVTVTRK